MVILFQQQCNKVVLLVSTKEKGAASADQYNFTINSKLPL